MTLSSRVLKADRLSMGRQRIAVEIPAIEESFPLETNISDAFGEVVDRAKREAQAIIEQAEEQAQSIRETARREGREQGIEEGRQVGLNEARQQWETLRQELQEPLALLEGVKGYVGRLNDESTLALAAALTLALFSRLKLERLDVVAAYIAELADSMDSGKAALFLDVTWGPRVRAMEEALQAVVPALTLAIDESLENGTMRVEGEMGGVLGGPLISLKALVEEVLG